MTFEYPVQGGAASRVTVRTHLTARLEDEPRKLLLYDPAVPSRAVLVATLPGAVSIDEAGQPAVHGSMAFLVLPALTILGNSLYVYRHWIAGP